jgi:general secretion pathway protein A
MYAAHFGLREPPFAITPDPAYVYLSRHHQEALAHLLYGVGENGGFVQLTGEVGTGKTTLVRTLLEQRLESVDLALCLNPRLTVEELLATVCDELGASYPRESHTLKALLDALNAHLLQTHAAGRRTVLILDEAQNLSREVLEQIRLLTNLETAKHKLLRIILVGQPELRTLLARPDLRQLAQRITARYHLPPLDRRETAAYIGHRLRVAGGREDLFTWGARRVVYRHSGGIPRLINIICDRALLGAYGRSARRVNASLARAAAREALQGRAGGRTWQPSLALATALAGLAMIGVGLWLRHADQSPPPAVSRAPAATPTPAEASGAMAPPLASATAAPAESVPPRTLIGPGASGAAVRWLRARLALAAGQPVPDPLSEVFDAALAEQVRAFQREHGLQPDGLAGPRTLALLNKLAPESDTPVPQPPEGNP